MIRGIKNYITAWLEYFDQRDLVKDLSRNSKTEAVLLEREKRRLHEMRAKAFNQKRMHA